MTETKSSCEYLTLFEQKEYSKVIDCVGEQTERLLYEWLDGMHEKLEKDLQCQTMLLDFFRDGLDENTRERSLFALGGLYRATKIYAALLFESGMDQRLRTQYEKELVGIKHLKEVVQALEIHGSMTHSELCDYLDLKPSTLTEAMKKILETHTISVLSAGKYRLYSLTDIGIRLGSQFRTKRRMLSPEDFLNDLRILLERLSGSDRKKEILDDIKKILEDEGANAIFRGDSIRYYSKNKEKNGYVDLIITNLLSVDNKKYVYGETDCNSEPGEDELRHCSGGDAYRPKTSAYARLCSS